MKLPAGLIKNSGLLPGGCPAGLAGHALVTLRKQGDENGSGFHRGLLLELVHRR
jgi:hypothetical protein